MYINKYYYTTWEEIVFVFSLFFFFLVFVYIILSIQSRNN